MVTTHLTHCHSVWHWNHKKSRMRIFHIASRYCNITEPSYWLAAHENSIFKVLSVYHVLKDRAPVVGLGIIVLIFRATPSATCSATTMATLQSIVNIDPWARECSMHRCDSPMLGNASPLELWNQSSGDILKSKMKISSKIQRSVMDLNAFLPSVIGSVTLWLAQRRSIENRTNRVASLGTKSHLIVLFVSSI